MHFIRCPYCDEHFEEVEFTYGGEVRRPLTTESPTDLEWSNFLFMKRNTKGVLTEYWLHSHGCMRWFQMERDTRNHQIQDVRSLSPEIVNDSGEQ